MASLKWTGILVTIFGISWNLLVLIVPEEGEAAIAGGSLIIIVFGLLMVLSSFVSD